MLEREIMKVCEIILFLLNNNFLKSVKNEHVLQGTKRMYFYITCKSCWKINVLLFFILSNHARE